MARSDEGTLSEITVSAYGKPRRKISAPIKQLSNPGVDMLQQSMNNNQKTLQDFSKYRELKKAGVTNVSRSQFHTLKGEKFKAGVSKVGENIKSGLKSGAGTIGLALTSEAGNAALDMVAGMIPDKGKNTSFKEQQQIGNVLMKAKNPYVKAAGLAYKGLSAVAELTGTNVSKMNSEQADAAGIGKGTKFLNNAASYIPGTGILGSTMNAEKSHVIDSMSGAYGGTVSDINTAGTMAGQNYLFGKRKANKFIGDMNDVNKLLTDINTTNTLRKSSDYGVDIAQQNLNRYAGTNYMDMRMGRSGLKLDSLVEIRAMLANRQSKNEEIEKFAHGGVLEGTNLIPSGKLHKELHHIEDSDSELAENLTRKGIPVVALSEGGEIEQVAEIEHSEITLSKALTDKLEELRKDGSEEAMIEAGKILVEEIMFNTDDKMGIINEEDSVNNK